MYGGLSPSLSFSSIPITTPVTTLRYYSPITAVNSTQTPNNVYYTNNNLDIIVSMFQSELQKYIQEHIKLITIEQNKDTICGTLVDKDNNTFTYSKNITEFKDIFTRFHKLLLSKNKDVRNNMIIVYFKKLFIREYIYNKSNLKLTTL